MSQVIRMDVDNIESGEPAAAESHSPLAIWPTASAMDPPWARRARAARARATTASAKARAKATAQGTGKVQHPSG